MTDILVVTDCKEDFEVVKSRLVKCLQDRFVIYQFSNLDNYVPSTTQTAAIIDAVEISANLKRLTTFFLQGGKVISKNSAFDKFTEVLEIEQKDFENIGIFSKSAEEGIYFQTNLDILEISEDNWREMLSKIIFPNVVLKSTIATTSASARATTAVLLGRPEAVSKFKSDLKLLSADLKVQQSNCSLDFSLEKCATGSGKNSIPIYYNESLLSEYQTFNWRQFDSELSTKALGRVVIHSEVVSSTFDFVDGLFLQHGLVVVADRQTSGRGRSGNSWLSPPGCAMMSLQLKIENIRRISLLQHLVALAAVHSIRALPQFKDLDIRLKWPNDIYYGRTTKLGGVIVFSSFFRNKLSCNVGLGINLDNESPTKCINQIISQNSQGSPVELISREIFLARILNHLENFLNEVEKPHGFKMIMDLYHNYWLHSNQEVSVTKEGSTEVIRGTVVRLDSDGYLVVKLADSEDLVTVHPDGNSFDMMQGLILPKRVKY